MSVCSSIRPRAPLRQLGGRTDEQTLITVSQGARQPTNTRYKAANIENEYSGAALFTGGPAIGGESKVGCLPQFVFNIPPAYFIKFWDHLTTKMGAGGWA